MKTKNNNNNIEENENTCLIIKTHCENQQVVFQTHSNQAKSQKSLKKVQ